MAINGNIFTIATPNTETASTLHQQLGGLLGVGKRSDGMYHQADMFTASTVNWGARYKPFKYSAYNFASDTERNNAHKSVAYGWKIPMALSGAVLSKDDYKWQMVKPVAPYYRMRDFDNYYHGAPTEFLTQNMGEKIVFNAMNPFPGLMSFYVYQRTGAMKDRPRAVGGVGSTAIGRTETQLNLSLGSEDLSIQNIGGANNAFTFYESGAQLGIVVPNSSGLTLDAQYFCDEPLVVPSTSAEATEKVGMYRKEFIDLGLASGTHEAIACIRWPYGVESLVGQSYAYARLQDVDGYPSKFTIEVNGVDKMLYTISGIALTDTTSTWSTSVKTGNQRYIYVKVVVKNTSGITITNTEAYQKRWNLRTAIKGSKTIAGGSSTSFEMEAVSSIYKWRLSGNSAWNSGSAAYISLDNNKSVELIFRVDNIYNDGEILDLLSSAMASFGFTPRFDEEGFTYNSSTVSTYMATYN